MAFGFPAYHVEGVTLPQPLTDEWLAYVVRSLGWTFSGRIPNARAPLGWVWRVGSGMNLMSWGEDLTLMLHAPQHVEIRSECTLPTQCIDWGRNETNVKRLAQALYHAMSQPPQQY